MDDGIYAIHMEGGTTAVANCPAGDFHADAHDAAEVPGVLRDGALHAATWGPGHEVDEVVSRSMRVVPSAWAD
jgi:hypothetical protein